MVPSLRIVLDMVWTSKVGNKRAVLGLAGLNMHQENLLYLKALVEVGKLRSAVDRRYPLEQVPDATAVLTRNTKREMSSLRFDHDTA